MMKHVILWSTELQAPFINWAKKCLQFPAQTVRGMIYFCSNTKRYFNNFFKKYHYFLWNFYFSLLLFVDIELLYFLIVKLCNCPHLIAWKRQEYILVYASEVQSSSGPWTLEGRMKINNNPHTKCSPEVITKTSTKIKCSKPPQRICYRNWWLMFSCITNARFSICCDNIFQAHG